MKRSEKILYLIFLDYWNWPRKVQFPNHFTFLILDKDQKQSLSISSKVAKELKF